MALYRSLDGGNNWDCLRILASGSDYLYSLTNAVAISPANEKTIYIGGSSLYKSIDGGITWTNISKDLNEREFLSLAVDPKSPKKIFAGTPQAFYRSINAGNSWTKMLDINSKCVLFHPIDPKVIFVGGQNGVYISRNSGDKWQLYSSGLIVKSVNWLDFNNVTGAIYAAVEYGSIWRRFY